MKLYIRDKAMVEQLPFDAQLSELELGKARWNNSDIFEGNLEWCGKIYSHHFIPSYNNVQLLVVGEDPTIYDGQHLAVLYDNCWISAQRLMYEIVTVEETVLFMKESLVILKHKHIELVDITDFSCS